MDNKQQSEEGFVRFNHSLYHAVLLSNFTIRQLRVVMLILRLTIGCHRKWARLIQADLQIVGITASHAGEILDELLNKAILIQNEKTSDYRLNEKYFILDDKKRKRLERLTRLIGAQIYKTSQNGNTTLPKMDTISFPVMEGSTSQGGNTQGFPNEDVFSLDNFNYNTSKDNDKDNVKHNVKESIVAIDSIKKEVINVDPWTFVPQNEAQECALEAWKAIEPGKPDSFNFYLWCAHKGLPPDMFDTFTNDVLSVEYKNPGAMFNTKATAYLEQNNLL